MTKKQVTDNQLIKEVMKVTNKLEDLLPKVKDRISGSDFKVLKMTAILLRITGEFGFARAPKMKVS